MGKMNEDDLLRPLFEKIKLEKAPDNLTSEIMNRIMVNPETEPVKRFYFEWWWIIVGLAGAISIYFTGAFSAVYESIAPYMIGLFEPVRQFVTLFMDAFPSNEVMLPSSVILPVIITGILYVLIFDLFLRQRLHQSVSN